MFLQPSKEADSLNSLSKPHFIGQDATNFQLVNLRVPMQTSFLVVFEDQVIGHERGFLNHESATFSLEPSRDVFPHTLAFFE